MLFCQPFGYLIISFFSATYAVRVYHVIDYRYLYLNRPRMVNLFCERSLRKFIIIVMIKKILQVLITL
jgi:hypothetical protein